MKSKQLKQFVDGFAEARPAERRVRLTTCKKCGGEVFFEIDEERPEYCEQCKKMEEK